ncbi:hypothetical protein HDF16_000144 [Granulicella aggregans]|uniref:Uncharacterized protein n=1 Tax=Granulicella aggregans TaxID=474949 RepID=A0A7W8E2T9_9BACT|nr:hypothetical protein [Granulicella aggregans]MBB5055475.1 hypothetical protein [Granulicella aggregans]
MNLQSLVATSLALSVAVERVIEILKQSVGATPLFAWLFAPSTNPQMESWRCTAIHLLSALIGGAIAKFSGIDILSSLGASAGAHPVLSYGVMGLLSAGGSAFWNHALDLIKAVKIDKEDTARARVAADYHLSDPKVVNL